MQTRLPVAIKKLLPANRPARANKAPPNISFASILVLKEPSEIENVSIAKYKLLVVDRLQASTTS